MAKEYKLGSAVASQTLTYAASVALKVDNSVSFFSVAMTGALTLTIDSASKALVPGTVIHIKGSSDGTARTITFSTGFTAPALAGTIDKTKVQSFIYNGSTFLPLGAALQID